MPEPCLKPRSGGFRQNVPQGWLSPANEAVERQPSVIVGIDADDSGSFFARDGRGSTW